MKNGGASGRTWKIGDPDSQLLRSVSAEHFTILSREVLRPIEATFGALAVTVEPVVVAVQGDGGNDRRVGVFETRLEGRIVHREGRERAQVRSGRSAGDEDLLRVAAVLACMVVHPRDRSLGVDQRIREGRVRAQSVVRLDAEPASAREVIHDRQALLILPAVGPRASVEVDQDGTVLRARSMNVEVEMVSDTAFTVWEVSDVYDVAPAGQERTKALVRDGERSLIARRQIGIDVLFEVRAQPAGRARARPRDQRRDSGAPRRGHRASPPRQARSRRCRAPSRARRTH